MRKAITFLACFVFFASFAISSGEEGYYSYSYARLSYVKGDVFVQRAQDLGYEEAVVNLSVIEGDKLGSREGRAEIHFGRRNYLRVDRYTQVDFVSLPKRGYDQIKLHLLSGSIFLRINSIEREKDFEVHTPDASFYVLEEGLFRFDVKENRETELHVYEGAVEAAGEEGSLLVEREEKLIATDGRFLSDPVSFYASLDDYFSEWNRDRDSLYARTVRRGYLPSELNEYELELSANGRWVYERPYGYVWVPHVYYDWRPYFYGRWIWYPIIGWNWVSYEPWGWCVYHYGRWHWRLGLGWYWIPTRHWGPAWVHWYWDHDYIGWCPLSYYGYPVVILNNHFYGRYYGRDYPLHSRALTVIHKTDLYSRRISKIALSSNRITRLKKISLSARQPSHRIVASPLSSVAKKVLSRSNIRSVKRSYVSKKTISSSARLKSLGVRNSFPFSSKSTSTDKNQRIIRRSGEISKTGVTSRSSQIYKSKSSIGKSYPTEKYFPSTTRSNHSNSIIKMYPSRQSTSFLRSKSLSSSKRDISDSNLSYSSKSRLSRLEIKAYTPEMDSNRTLRSKISSLRKSEESSLVESFRPADSVSRSISDQYSSRKSISSSTKRISEGYFVKRGSSSSSNYSREYSHKAPSRSISRSQSSYSKSLSSGRSRISSRSSFSSGRSSSSSSRVSRSSKSKSSSRSRIRKR